MANISIEGQGATQVISSNKSVSLSFVNTGSAVLSTNITNVKFDISSSAITKSLIIMRGSGLTLKITNVTFNVRVGLSAPLLSLSDGNIIFDGITIERINNANSVMERLSNADDSICATQTGKSGILLSNILEGNISTSTFKNINTGAMIISGGVINLNGVTFSDNYISRPTGFPSLRHNVFMSNNARVTVSGLQTDTGDSSFIYTSEVNGGVVNGLEDSPLFVPVFSSAQPSSLSDGETTIFAFSGRFIFPCGLFFNFYRGDESTAQLTPIALNIPDENTATTTLNNSLFSDGGSYYGYFMYGPGLSFKTPTVRLLAGPSSQSKAGAGLVVGIVIAVIAVLALVFVIIFFFAWRYRIQKRWTTESAAERSGAPAGESTKVRYY
jgi:hypothetical protein